MCDALFSQFPFGIAIVLEYLISEIHLPIGCLLSQFLEDCLEKADAALIIILTTSLHHSRHVCFVTST